MDIHRKPFENIVYLLYNHNTRDKTNPFLAAAAYNMEKWMRLKQQEILNLIFGWIYQRLILVSVNIHSNRIIKNVFNKDQLIKKEKFDFFELFKTVDNDLMTWFLRDQLEDKC